MQTITLNGDVEECPPGCGGAIRPGQCINSWQVPELGSPSLGNEKHSEKKHPVQAKATNEVPQCGGRKGVSQRGTLIYH